MHVFMPSSCMCMLLFRNLNVRLFQSLTVLGRYMEYHKLAALVSANIMPFYELARQCFRIFTKYQNFDQTVHTVYEQQNGISRVHESVLSLKLRFFQCAGG